MSKHGFPNDDDPFSTQACLEGGISFTSMHLASVVALSLVVVVLVALQLRAVDRVAAAEKTISKSLLLAVQGTRMLQGLLLMGYARTCSVTISALRAPGGGDNVALPLAALVLVVLGLPLLSYWYIYSRRDRLAQMVQPPASARAVVLGRFLLSGKCMDATQPVVVDGR